MVRIDNGTVRSVYDEVSVEEPLEIQIVSGKASGRIISPLSVTMRTPGHDQELAVGFLFTEGIIQERDQVINLETVSNNVVRIHVDPSLEVDKGLLTRNFYTTSSCGVCGKASIDAIHVASQAITNTLMVTSKVLRTLPGQLLQSQRNFQSTGGLHASALFDKFGAFKFLREDVGRHNALDKVIGNQFLKKMSMNDSMLLVSGRASFELIQKAAVTGIPIVAAIGAPSSLAVELAVERGITLIGFLKEERFNIYSHKNRVQFT